MDVSDGSDARTRTEVRTCGGENEDSTYLLSSVASFVHLFAVLSGEL